MSSRKAKSLALAAIGLAVAALAPASAPSADPKVLRFAFQGELKSVDRIRSTRASASASTAPSMKAWCAAAPT